MSKYKDYPVMYTAIDVLDKDKWKIFPTVEDAKEWSQKQEEEFKLVWFEESYGGILGCKKDEDTKDGEEKVYYEIQAHDLSVWDEVYK